MKLCEQAEIALPTEDVYCALRDVDAHARTARPRGVTVRRRSDETPFQVSAACDVIIAYRGQPREVLITAAGLEPARLPRFTLRARDITGEITLALTALLPISTQLSCDVAVRPRTIGARLVLQSLKLTQTRLDARFGKRLTGFAQQLVARSRDSD